MTELTDLIAALEKATGPDRELDGRIYRAVADPRWDNPDVTESDKAIYCRCASQPYTASIDAAMTLVPPQHGYYVRENRSADGDEIYCNAQVWPYSDPRDDEAPRYWANSKQGQPAIALCIASLRARALEGGKKS